MALPRVNHNIPALRAQRHLTNVHAVAEKNLERLSSGLKINRGADGPASLVISENMRAKISGLNQAIENTESGVSLVQTAEGALAEMSNLLKNMRQLAIHASNAGVNDENMLQADQQELENSLQTMNRIAQNTQFGSKNLLDGSKGANGVATGANLQFVSAGVVTKSAPKSGYQVRVARAATQATVTGNELTQDVIDAGEILTIAEGGKTVQFTTAPGNSPASVVNHLRAKIDDADLNINIELTKKNEIRMWHKEYGSTPLFTVASSTDQILSQKANSMFAVNNGLDILGEIDGEEAMGTGQFLEGRVDNKNTAGLKVRYTGSQYDLQSILAHDPARATSAQIDTTAPVSTKEATTQMAPISLEDAPVVGSVTVSQNSLLFQVGANAGQTVSLSLRDMRPTSLGRNMEIQSDYQSLNDLDLTSFQGAQDAIHVIDQAIYETSSTRAMIGAFQTNSLESTLSNLRVASENLTASESLIRDADFAKEMANFTRNQIVMQSAISMLAQANQQPRSIISLLQ